MTNGGSGTDLFRLTIHAVNDSPEKYPIETQKAFYILKSNMYCISIQYSCGVKNLEVVIGGNMQDYLLESLKLQRIDFFIKLVAASDCSDEEKRLAIQWVSELTDDLLAKIRSHEYSRSMDVTS